MWNQRKTYRNENTIKESTEDRQACEHNKMFEERWGNKHEAITVVSLLFINLVIHCHRLALSIFISSQQEAPSSITQMDAQNNIDVWLPYICSLFLCQKHVCINRAIWAPVHGKDLLDGLNACDKQHLKRYMKRINQPHEGYEDRNIKPYLIYFKKVSLADECRRHCLEGR